MIKRAASILAITTMFYANFSFAGSTSQSFLVTATVSPTCTMSAITALAFGSYNFASTNPTTQNTIITYECTTGVSSTANIGLNAGNAPGATTSTRKMQNGVNTLAYGLYSDSAYKNNWGNNQGVDTVPIIADGTQHTVTVYGSVPVNQAVPSGSYTDTITATITF
jgi:spore coat protein U-like protein